jgi:hypothetical protein
MTILVPQNLSQAVTRVLIFCLAFVRVGWSDGRGARISTQWTQFWQLISTASILLCEIINVSHSCIVPGVFNRVGENYFWASDVKSTIELVVIVNFWRSYCGIEDLFTIIQSVLRAQKFWAHGGKTLLGTWNHPNSVHTCHIHCLWFLFMSYVVFCNTELAYVLMSRPIYTAH